MKRVSDVVPLFLSELFQGVIVIYEFAGVPVILAPLLPSPSGGSLPCSI